MLIPEKVAIAQMLEKLNVDVIEAGFAAASKGDFLSIQEVGNAVRQPIVSSLCRSIKEDIDVALEALKNAKRARIHVVLSASDFHLHYKLNMTQGQALRQAVSAVEYARKKCADVQFTVEDAGRTEYSFLVKMVGALVQAGASTVSLSDTVGYCLPEEFGDLIRRIREDVAGLDRSRLGVHVHNDLGFALASTIAAIQAGAEQAACTVNGIGDKAGICALEELVNTIKIRQDSFPFIRTDVREEFFLPASKLVAKATGTRIPYYKSVVGSRASMSQFFV